MCRVAETLAEENGRLTASLRICELVLAERPTCEDVEALRQSAASALADSESRVQALKEQLASLPDLLFSAQTERLTARIRLLESELAEAVPAPTYAQSRSGLAVQTALEDQLARIDALLAMRLPTLKPCARSASFTLRRRVFTSGEPPVSQRRRATFSQMQAAQPPAVASAATLEPAASTSQELPDVVAPLLPAAPPRLRRPFTLRRHIFAGSAT